MPAPLIFSINVQGEKHLELVKQLLPDAIPDALAQMVATMKAKLQGATPVGIKYVSFGLNRSGKKIYKRGKHAPEKRWRGRWVASGELKKSWQEELIEEATGAAIAFTTDRRYYEILESGGYPGIGKPRWGLMSGGGGVVSPRTQAAPGGIFSSRAVGGIAGPLFRNEAFVDNTLRTLAKKITESLKRAGA